MDRDFKIHFGRETEEDDVGMIHILVENRITFAEWRRMSAGQRMGILEKVVNGEINTNILSDICPRLCVANLPTDCLDIQSVWMLEREETAITIAELAASR